MAPKKALLWSKIQPHRSVCWQKRDLIKIAMHNLYYWFSEVLLLIEPSPTVIRRRIVRISIWRRKNAILKSLDYESESYNKFKNCLLKKCSAQPMVNNLWKLFRKVYHFCKVPFLWVSYLSTSSRVLFFMCHFCEVLLFSNSWRSTFSARLYICWV